MSQAGGGWLGVAVAPDAVLAESWCELLRGDGIAARIDPNDVMSFLGVSATPVKILVPEDDLGRARETLGPIASQNPGT